MSTWKDLADSVIQGYVTIETTKAQGGANTGSQHNAVSQPQIPQVIPQQQGVTNQVPKDNTNTKMIAMVGGGAAALLLLILVLK